MSEPLNKSIYEIADLLADEAFSQIYKDRAFTKYSERQELASKFYKILTTLQTHELREKGLIQKIASDRDDFFTLAREAESKLAMIRAFLTGKVKDYKSSGHHTADIEEMLEAIQ